MRYTAPSLIFGSQGQTLEAGGFQPVEAYDVLHANLDPTLERTPPPDDPLDALQALPICASPSRRSNYVSDHYV